MDTFSTSEYNITYLIGAGASAKALPTVKQTESTAGISQALRNCAFNLNSDLTISHVYKEYVNQIILDLNWIADNSDKFGTPDTFAKFLYLQDRSSLPRLKNTLSLYFTIEQFINNKIDQRALIFLTTVMQIGNVFPTNIKILNWNYDFQIQLAAETYRKEEFHLGVTSIHSPPLIAYYPSLGFEFNMNHDQSSKEFSLVHLNGIAGFFHNEDARSNLNFFINEKPKDINEIFEKISKSNIRNHTLLTFAWEESTEAAHILRQRINFAKKTVINTDILVIIGYSFPFFNRNVDKQIFEALKESGKLRKIIYQDPYRTGDFLKKQFDLSDDVEIINVTEKDNYYVPIEL
jgi:hypothetical protein